ncbi:hypothetical protein G9A89_018507 [Geosiphon pyriformis]|nr:hypothetical protein G9A89_018507 [Geosiphon pyriformis]
MSKFNKKGSQKNPKISANTKGPAIEFGNDIRHLPAQSLNTTDSVTDTRPVKRIRLFVKSRETTSPADDNGEGSSRGTLNNHVSRSLSVPGNQANIDKTSKSTVEAVQSQDRNREEKNNVTSAPLNAHAATPRPRLRLKFNMASTITPTETKKTKKSHKRKKMMTSDDEADEKRLDQPSKKRSRNSNVEINQKDVNLEDINLNHSSTPELNIEMEQIKRREKEYKKGIEKANSKEKGKGKLVERQEVPTKEGDGKSAARQKGHGEEGHKIQEVISQVEGVVTRRKAAAVISSLSSSSTQGSPEIQTIGPLKSAKRSKHTSSKSKPELGNSVKDNYHPSDAVRKPKDELLNSANKTESTPLATKAKSEIAKNDDNPPLSNTNGKFKDHPLLKSSGGKTPASRSISSPVADKTRHLPSPGMRKIAVPRRKPVPAPPKKTELRTILLRLMDSFERKDPYAFFLEPVDTTVVTDYLDHIKNPMDFTTMRHKIDDQIYKNIDSFKVDLSLICNNCMTYNAPSTQYYKTAEKLLRFGEKAIERERNSILKEEAKIQEYLKNEEAKKKYQDQTEGIGRNQENGELTALSSINKRGKGKLVNSATSDAPKPGRKRRRTPNKFELDGSLRPLPDHNEIIFDESSFAETPLLTVIGNYGGVNPKRFATFPDYGPTATLGSERLIPLENSENYHMRNLLGDHGMAYTRSLKDFIKDMDEDVNQKADEILDEVSLGAFSIDKMVTHFLASESTTRGNSVVNTCMGFVDVAREIDKIRARQREEELQKQISEALMDLNFLGKSQNMANTMAPPICDTISKLLAKNLASFKQLFRAQEEGNIGGIQHVVDDTRESLAQVVAVTNVTSYQPRPATVPPSGAHVQQQMIHSPVFPLAHSQAPAVGVGPNMLLAPTTFGFGTNQLSSNSHARLPPTSVVRPARQRAHRGGARCANCQTTDTPGWRAGETPEQKLCNACGLYFAKNRTHRPSNLWTHRN